MLSLLRCHRFPTIASAGLFFMLLTSITQAQLNYKLRYGDRYALDTIDLDDLIVIKIGGRYQEQIDSIESDRRKTFHRKIDSLSRLVCCKPLPKLLEKVMYVAQTRRNFYYPQFEDFVREKYELDRTCTCDTILSDAILNMIREVDRHFWINLSYYLMVNVYWGEGQHNSADPVLVVVNGLIGVREVEVPGHLGVPGYVENRIDMLWFGDEIYSQMRRFNLDGVIREYIEGMRFGERSGLQLVSMLGIEPCDCPQVRWGLASRQLQKLREEKRATTND